MSRRRIAVICLVGVGIIATLTGGVALLQRSAGAPTRVQAAASPNGAGSSGFAEINFEYTTLEGQLRDATAVVVGTVAEELPVAKNKGGGWTSTPGVEVLPVDYQGYVVDVKQWFGGGDPSKSVRVFSLAPNAGSEGNLIPRLKAGQEILAAIRHSNYYGVPMAADEYWLVSDGIGLSIVQDGVAQLAVPLQGIAPPEAGVRDKRSVDSLIQMMIGRGFEQRAVR